jgi:hypothetical protein
MSELTDAMEVTAQEWRERHRLTLPTLAELIQAVLDDELLPWRDEEDQTEGWASDASPERITEMVVEEVKTWLRARPSGEAALLELHDEERA